MLAYLFRAIIYGLIAISLKGSPLTQIILYVLISIFFLVLIFLKKPAKIRLGNLELFIYEIIIFVTLCFAMALVVNDAKGISNIDKEALGTHVIIGFIALYIFEIIFIIINVVYAIRTRCGSSKKKDEEAAPKFVWPAINTEHAKKTEDADSETDQNRVVIIPKVEMPTVRLK